MHSAMEWLQEQLDLVLAGASPTVRVVLVLSLLLMFGGWLAAYALIFFQCRRQKTYGVPLWSSCLNLGWEAVFSFPIVASYPYKLLMWGNRLWLVFDLFIFGQLVVYGRKEIQRESHLPWIQRNFYLFLTIIFFVSTLLIYSFCTYVQDVYGLIGSFIQNLIMSLLFFFLYAMRWKENLRGISYSAAWAKMIGTAAAGVFCALWWPLQFSGGFLKYQTPPVSEPRSYLFLYVLSGLTAILDCAYIYTVARGRKKIQQVATLTAGITPVPA